MIGHADALVWARAYCFGQWRLAPFVRRGPVYNHWESSASSQSSARGMRAKRAEIVA